jgi:hypothetical protein
MLYKLWDGLTDLLEVAEVVYTASTDVSESAALLRSSTPISNPERGREKGINFATQLNWVRKGEKFPTLHVFQQKTYIVQRKQSQQQSLLS